MNSVSVILTTLMLGSAGCDAAPTPKPNHADAPFQIPYGAPQSEVARRLGLPGTAAPTVGGCRYWRPAGLPAGLRLMIDDGRVVRSDVDSGSARTPEGAGIGSTEAEVGSRYPGLVTQPHQYRSADGWHYLIARSPADSTLRFVFETDGHRVTTFRAGIEPFVEYVEGCG
jgi:hypothetical protein